MADRNRLVLEVLEDRENRKSSKVYIRKEKVKGSWLTRKTRNN